MTTPRKKIPELDALAIPLPDTALFELSLNPGSKYVPASTLRPRGTGPALVKSAGSYGADFWANASVNNTDEINYTPAVGTTGTIFYPFQANRDCLLAKLGLHQLTVGSGSPLCHVGIYDSIGIDDPYPNALLYDTPDFDFTISGNIYLFIYGTPSSPIQLYAGRWYWLAFEGNADMDSASNGIPGIKQAGLQTPYGRSNISSPYELGSRAKVTGHALARSYGPFPGTFPAGNQPIGPSTYNTAGFYAPAIVPEILMQFSN